MPMGRARRFAGCLAAALATLVPATPARAAVPVITIDGRGFGHGVGMAQDGALEMGRRGFTLGQILGQFYPGVTLAHAGGDVRVPVLSAAGSATVTFPDGGQIVDTLSGPQSPGFPVAVPAGDAAVLSWNGSTYTAVVTAPPGAPATTTTGRPTTTTRAPTTTTSTTGLLPLLHHAGAVFTAGAVSTAATGPAASSRPLWAVPAGQGAVGVPARGRSYRGMVEAAGIPGTLRLINQVDVETYLVGMGEVQDPSWPLQSLEAQEVAARTYALRAMATGGELCDDTRCQVYVGVADEYPAAARAVAATAGTVMIYGRGLADAVYSANAAGWSATREEGFGQTDAAYPYLRAAPYPAHDPDRWSVDVATADVAARLGLHPPLTNIAVSRKGPSGRALALTLTAGGQTVSVTGLAFAAALGLRSTLIDAIRVASASTAPPPPARGVLQVLPDNAGAIASLASGPARTTTTSTSQPPAVAAPAVAPSRHHDGVVPIGPVVAAVVLLLLVIAAGAKTAAPRRAPPSSGT